MLTAALCTTDAGKAVDDKYLKKELPDDAARLQRVEKAIEAAKAQAIKRANAVVGDEPISLPSPEIAVESKVTQETTTVTCTEVKTRLGYEERTTTSFEAQQGPVIMDGGAAAASAAAAVDTPSPRKRKSRANVDRTDNGTERKVAKKDMEMFSIDQTNEAFKKIKPVSVSHDSCLLSLQSNVIGVAPSAVASFVLTCPCSLRMSGKELVKICKGKTTSRFEVTSSGATRGERGQMGMRSARFGLLPKVKFSLLDTGRLFLVHLSRAHPTTRELDGS